MTKRKNKYQYSVRLNQNGKVLNFSTQASRAFTGYEDVDVFEKEGVVAVRATKRGSYHISGEAGRPRKVLSNQQMVTYLCKKFNCSLGVSLPAWVGEQEGVLFFGGLQPKEEKSYELDESYTPIEVEYNRRAGDWAYVHDNWIEFTQEVLEVLPRRLSAYRCGRAVMLIADPTGTLTLTSRRQSGKQLLVSPALANYLREMYGGVERGMRLRAAILPGGLGLADNIETLTMMDLTIPPELLDLNESKYCFTTLIGKGSLYLSSAATALLDNTSVHLGLYRHASFLALKNEPDGPLRVSESGYAHYIHSNYLCSFLKERWPKQRRFYLLRYDKFLILWPEAICHVEIPPATSFRKVALNNGFRKQERETVQRIATINSEKRIVDGL